MKDAPPLASDIFFLGFGAFVGCTLNSFS